MRLTKDVRQKILDQNENFCEKTSFKSRNFRESRTYTVKGGELHIREHGKTSWSDSHFDNTRVADDEETRRFLHNYKHKMKMDGIE